MQIKEEKVNERKSLIMAVQALVKLFRFLIPYCFFSSWGIFFYRVWDLKRLLIVASKPLKEEVLS